MRDETTAAGRCARLDLLLRRYLKDLASAGVVGLFEPRRLAAYDIFPDLFVAGRYKEARKRAFL